MTRGCILRATEFGDVRTRANLFQFSEKRQDGGLPECVLSDGDAGAEVDGDDVEEGDDHVGVRLHTGGAEASQGVEVVVDEAGEGARHHEHAQGDGVHHPVEGGVHQEGGAVDGVLDGHQPDRGDAARSFDTPNRHVLDTRRCHVN